MTMLAMTILYMSLCNASMSDVRSISVGESRLVPVLYEVLLLAQRAGCLTARNFGHTCERVALGTGPREFSVLSLAAVTQRRTTCARLRRAPVFAFGRHVRKTFNDAATNDPRHAGVGSGARSMTWWRFFARKPVPGPGRRPGELRLVRRANLQLGHTPALSLQAGGLRRRRPGRPVRGEGAHQGDRHGRHRWTLDA